MSSHLILDPNRLYSLYTYKGIQEYYPFDCFTEFSSIDVDIFYDILNSISEKQLFLYINNNSIQLQNTNPHG